MAQAVRVSSGRPIKLRRLIEFHGSSSLGIVLPKSFVDRMGLRPGNYMSVEMDGESLTMNKCSVTNPGITNVGEGED